MTAECIGKFWEGQPGGECAVNECAVSDECLAKFATETLVGYQRILGPEGTPAQLASMASVSSEAIQTALQFQVNAGINPAMPTPTEQTNTTAPVRNPSQQNAPENTVPPPENAQGQNQVPPPDQASTEADPAPKKKRGRKKRAANKKKAVKVTCPNCAGTGKDGDYVCEQCQGTGTVEAAASVEPQVQSTSMGAGAGAEPPNSPATSGHGNNPNVGGQPIQGNSPGGALPVSGQAMADPGQHYAGNQGGQIGSQGAGAQATAGVQRGPVLPSGPAIGAAQRVQSGQVPEAIMSMTVGELLARVLGKIAL